MEIRYFKHYSGCLGRDMEFKVYGHSGKPVLFIPCQGGRFFDFENYKMIDYWAKWIEAGQVTVYACDVIDGETYRASLQTWARWVASDTQIPGLRPFREYDAATRCKLYADLEFAYLSQYVVTPLYYRNSAQMLSQKGDYPTATYVDPVEFGGIRFYTYFYDDTAWNQIKSGLQY